MAYPPIPTLMRGTGGAIRIRKRKRPKAWDGTDVWWMWDDSKRLITIDTTASREHQWRVLFHELTHAALHDSGMENLFDDKGVEALCDAFATARMHELRGELGIIDS